VQLVQNFAEYFYKIKINNLVLIKLSKLYNFMNWASFPFLRVATVFALGIFVAEYFGLGYMYFLIPGLIALISYIAGDFYIQNARIKSLAQGGLLLFMFFSLGGIISNRQQQAMNVNYIMADDNMPATLYITLTESLKSSKGFRWLADVHWLKNNEQKIIGKQTQIIIKFDESDLVAGAYKKGSSLICELKLQDVPRNTNPEAFDFGGLLRYKGILQQGNVKIGKHHADSLTHENIVQRTATATTAYATGVIRKYIESPSNAGIAEALLLGQKTLLGDDIYQSYANTGAIHVLSVSGLHVAIFISGFIWLFNRSKRQDIGWKLFKLLILMAIVWFYVILTGLSPSVVRAGVMVTLYLIGTNLFKTTNSYNILSVAALIMLLYQPFYLFQTSFQFSYISLLSILYFQPKISALWSPPNKALQFLWNLVNISLAAQILIFPFTVYYFHQFPIYFVVSGVIAVPLVSVIIYLGTGVLLIEAFWPKLNAIFGYLLDELVNLLNMCIVEISQWPFSVITDIYINDIVLFIISITLICFIIWLETRNFSFFVAILVCLVVITMQQIHHNFQCKKVNKMFVYDTYGGNLVDIFSGDKRWQIVSGNLNNKVIQYAAGNNRIKYYDGIRMDTVTNKSSTYLYQIGEKKVYINNKYENPEYIQPQKVHLLVITKEANIHPQKLIGKFKPDIIILERNLPPWQIKKWHICTENTKITIHDIKTKGAFEYTFE
jgi:competence protein ComEC